MKKIFSLALACAAATLVGCAGAPGEAPDVGKVQAACAADALIRPSVSALLTVSGLATVEERAAVMAARAVIDPICANPSAPLQQSAMAGFSTATAQVLAVYVEIRQRRSAPPVAAASSAPQ